jgi:hypothetical protein
MKVQLDLAVLLHDFILTEGARLGNEIDGAQPVMRKAAERIRSAAWLIAATDS